MLHVFSQNNREHLQLLSYWLASPISTWKMHVRFGLWAIGISITWSVSWMPIIKSLFRPKLSYEIYEVEFRKLRNLINKNHWVVNHRFFKVRNLRTACLPATFEFRKSRNLWIDDKINDSYLLIENRNLRNRKCCTLKLQLS